VKQKDIDALLSLNLIVDCIPGFSLLVTFKYSHILALFNLLILLIVVLYSPNLTKH